MYYSKRTLLIIFVIFIAIVAIGSVIALEWVNRDSGNDSNLLIVFYVQIMPDDFVMQLHR
ncbi:hypothetical protein NP001_18915, partial [Salmonella enterica]|nr:hypothetical protein [Salmonella enterica]